MEEIAENTKRNSPEKVDESDYPKFKFERRAKPLISLKFCTFVQNEKRKVPMGLMKNDWRMEKNGTRPDTFTGA